MQAIPRAAVQIAPSAVIGEYCVLGCLKEARLKGAGAELKESAREAAEVVIGERCLLFNQVVIYEGSRLGDGCVVEDRVRIGYNTCVGYEARLVYGAFICDRVSIGNQARVAGFVCDGTSIGDRSTVMGQLVHEYSRPHRGWWEVDESSPVIHEDVVVGFNATVVGDVSVGPRSYVAAGAVVTRDVPPGYVVTRTNKLTPASEWPGARLQELLLHWQRLSSG
ncbi:MAG: acyltransferase [Pseudonocardiaceae bacterium]